MAGTPGPRESQEPCADLSWLGKVRSMILNSLEDDGAQMSSDSDTSEFGITEQDDSNFLGLINVQPLSSTRNGSRESTPNSPTDHVLGKDREYQTSLWGKDQSVEPLRVTTNDFHLKKGSYDSPIHLDSSEEEDQPLEHELERPSEHDLEQPSEGELEQPSDRVLEDLPSDNEHEQDEFDEFDDAECLDELENDAADEFGFEAKDNYQSDEHSDKGSPVYIDLDEGDVDNSSVNSSPKESAEESHDGLNAEENVSGPELANSEEHSLEPEYEAYAMAESSENPDISIEAASDFSDGDVFHDFGDAETVDLAALATATSEHNETVSVDLSEGSELGEFFSSDIVNAFEREPGIKNLPLLNAQEFECFYPKVEMQTKKENTTSTESSTNAGQDASAAELDTLPCERETQDEAEEVMATNEKLTETQLNQAGSATETDSKPLRKPYIGPRNHYELNLGFDFSPDWHVTEPCTELRPEPEIKEQEAKPEGKESEAKPEVKELEAKETTLKNRPNHPEAKVDNPVTDKSASQVEYAEYDGLWNLFNVGYTVELDSDRTGKETQTEPETQTSSPPASEEASYDTLVFRAYRLLSKAPLFGGVTSEKVNAASLFTPASNGTLSEKAAKFGSFLSMSPLFGGKPVSASKDEPSKSTNHSAEGDPEVQTTDKARDSVSNAEVQSTDEARDMSSAEVQYADEARVPVSDAEEMDIDQDPVVANQEVPTEHVKESPGLGDALSVDPTVDGIGDPTMTSEHSKTSEQPSDDAPVKVAKRTASSQATSAKGKRRRGEEANHEESQASSESDVEPAPKKISRPRSRRKSMRTNRKDQQLSEEASKPLRRSRRLRRASEEQS